MNLKRGAVTAALATTLSFCALTAALAKPTVVINLGQAIVTMGPDGTPHLAEIGEGVPIAKGAEIRYTISAKDTGTDPARRLMLTGHIPAGTVLVAGSVRAVGGKAEFSLDGKRFARKPMVAETTPNGSELVPADPDTFVMVRWVKDGALAPGASIAFSYDVRVQ